MSDVKEMTKIEELGDDELENVAGGVPWFLNGKNRRRRPGGGWKNSNVTGLAQNAKSFSENVYGINQNSNTLSQSVTGLNENVQGLSQSVTGLNENVSGLNQNQID